MPVHMIEEQLRKHHLTEREIEVTLYWIMDYNYKQIAQRLFISHFTARTIIRNIHAKMGVKSKAALILLIFVEIIGMDGRDIKY